LKYYILFSLSTLCLSISASKRLPKNLRYKTLEDIQMSGSVIKKSKGRLKNTVYIKKKFRPHFEKAKEKISTFEKIPGCLVGNIISSGQGVKVTVKACGTHSLPDGSYFACIGTNLLQKYDHRVLLSCKRLITPHKEYAIDASIKDYHDVDGLKADEVFDGLEEGVLSAGATTLFQSVIETFKTKEQTSNGTINKNTVGNIYAGGLQDGASAGNSEFRSRASERKVVLVIKSGKKVLIEFNKEFFYEL